MPTPSRSPWLHREPAPDVAGRVFCIPQAGCGTSVFDRWPQRWKGIEFVPVELPGRLPRFAERMPASFQDLAEAMVTDLAPYLQVPFGFFGHCWSGVAAFEAVAFAERSGRGPATLIVSSDLPPHTPRTGVMESMDDGELVGVVAEAIRAFGGQPHPELMRIYVQILRGDMALRQRYVPSPPAPLRGRIAVLGWTEDTEVPLEDLPTWSECGDAEVRILPGGHNSYTEAPAEMLDLICTAVGG